MYGTKRKWHSIAPTPDPTLPNKNNHSGNKVSKGANNDKNETITKAQHQIYYLSYVFNYWYAIN